MKAAYLVSLTTYERAMIREAIESLRKSYVFSAAENHIADELLRRIPDPEKDE